MKSKIPFVSLVILICMSTACSANQLPQAQTPVTTHIKAENDLKVIYNDKFFKIVKGSDSEYYYVYNMDKVVVDDNKYPTVKQVNDDVLDIYMGMGTGLTWHQYYSIQKDSFSRTYWYVIAFEDEMVAYIYVPDDHPFEGRQIVIRNVFDKSKYYKEFNLDLSKVDTPITKAIFINNGSQLQVTYLTGENQEEVTQLFNLN